MKKGELERGRKKGCLTVFLILWVVFMVKVISILDLNFGDMWDSLKAGDVAGFAYLWLVIFFVLLSCCPVLYFGALSQKVTFGKNSRSPQPLRWINGR